jgi:hypothetical protein
MIDWIGYHAPTLITASFVPQGLHCGWPIVIANTITLLLAAGILGMRVRFGTASKDQAFVRSIFLRNY